MDKLHYDRADYSVVVKNRAPPPKACRTTPFRPERTIFARARLANSTGAIPRPLLPGSTFTLHGRCTAAMHDAAAKRHNDAARIANRIRNPGRLQRSS
jgi:hypothetical protein